MLTLLSLRIVLLISFVMGESFVNAQKVIPDAVQDLANQISTRLSKEQKRRIAVIPFRELGGEPTVFGTYLSEELVTDLVNTGTLDLVERATLDKVLGELKLNESGAVDPNTAKQVGKLVGADAIVTGTITDLQSYVGVNCRLIDTQTGRIFAAAQARVVKDDDVKKIMGVPLSSGARRDEGQTASSRKGVPQQPEKGDKALRFQTDSYRVMVESVRKDGKTASLVLVIEGLESKLVTFRGCWWFLIDENGEKWETDDNDTAGVCDGAGGGVQLSQGTKVRTKLTFKAKELSDGSRFTLFGRQLEPNEGAGRQILIEGIASK